MTTPRDVERAARNLAATLLAAAADDLAAEAERITDRARAARAAGITTTVLAERRHMVDGLRRAEADVRRRAANLAATNSAPQQHDDAEPLPLFAPSPEGTPHP